MNEENMDVLAAAGRVAAPSAAVLDKAREQLWSAIAEEVVGADGLGATARPLHASPETDRRKLSEVPELTSPPPTRPRRRPARRAVLATLGIAAALVAVAVVLVRVHTLGQRLDLHPASPSDTLVGPGPAAGTMFVADIGPSGNGGGITTPGWITVYRPGASGDAHPEGVITKGIDGPLGFAVDSSGDLWVANALGNSVVEYSRAELVKASPAPTVTLRIGGSPSGVAFDASGNLWVDAPSTGAPLGSLEEFARPDLAKSGAPAPVFTLNEDDCRSALDSSGDVWEGSGANTLSEWTKPQLAAPGSATPPAPKVLISSPELQSGCTPAFDRAGNLWVANIINNTVVEFSKAQLAKSGERAPKVVISSSILSYPSSVKFDATGNLWVPNQGNDTLVEYAKAQLTKSGAPAPARTISGRGTRLNYCYAVVFEP